MSVNKTVNFSNDENDDEMFSESQLEAMEMTQKDISDDCFETGNYEDIQMDNSFKMFLNDLSDIPLLTAEEELELAKNAAAGDKAAKGRLIESNIRLVISIAKHYQGHGVQLQDLVQYGVIGLMKGIDKYEFSKGFRVSTYVTWWIRQAIARAASEYGRSIRIPVHMSDKVTRLNREKSRLEAELGYEPDAKTLAKAMGIKRREAEELMMMSAPYTSLDAPVGEDGDMVFADTLKDENNISAEKQMEDAYMKNEIYKLLELIPERECEVIMLRFGLKDGKEHTLEEVGNMFGVSRERIRQIEAAAIRKLRKAAVGGFAS